MTVVVVVVASLALATFAFLLKARGSPAVDDSDGDAPSAYVLNESVLTPAERSFHGALCLCVGEELVVLAKVRLADVFTPDKRLEKGRWRAAQNRIDQKHVDFLLCHQDTLAPVAAIELDDSSHTRERQRKGDQFKDNLFAQSTIPLIRFTAKRAYEPVEVSAAVNNAIATKRAGA